jgi:hypothetical protein
MTCDSCRLCRETPVADVLSQDTAGGTQESVYLLGRGTDPDVDQRAAWALCLHPFHPAYD